MDLPAQIKNMSRRVAELRLELNKADHYRKPIVLVAIRAVEDHIWQLNQRARRWNLVLS